MLADIDNSSVASLRAAQSSIEQRLTTLNPSSTNYEQQNANLLKIKARLAEIADKQKVVNTIVDQYNTELENAGMSMRKVATNTELVNRTMKSLDKASIRDIEYSLKIVNSELKDMERGTEEFRQMTKKPKNLIHSLSRSSLKAQLKNHGLTGSLIDLTGYRRLPCRSSHHLQASLLLCASVLKIILTWIPPWLM